ncbi:hypothetical protein BCR44DRAFT_305576 [Catenaria anguillulae PL171]|uniref:Uncharacterized protein n=1 Tax=Catenaria anguillulae PL171 TaxID=765915 RepID=A0A1Y2I356_9FUNG|nr:hypothetical protein BCR44DRAFT_305576 [Catenaria anguillulae PL171]
MWIACYNSYMQKQRVDIVLGTATTAFLFLGMVLDPIVAVLQERRLRRALMELLFPRTLQSLKPSSSTVEGTGTSTDSPNESLGQRNNNSHLMSVM